MDLAYIAIVRKPPEQINTGKWMLDPSITYLNHGSFGARPKAVYEAQQRYKMILESSPVDFLDRKREELLGKARHTIAGFLGAEVDGFGFVDNATTGVGCAVHSIDFHEGDEILTTSLVYNGIRKLLSNRAKRTGATYREVHIPFPLHHRDELTTLIFDAITPATTLLVIDHVASTSSVLFPVEDIVSQCKERGLLVVVDGAHAPGMLDLNINAIAADWYVGNLHKWMCAPLGAGFIWTAAEHRQETHPMSISHFLDLTYVKEFDWQGTRDISPWLTVEDAVKWGQELGWVGMRKHNHDMATWMQARLVEAWEVDPFTPLDGSMIGTMVTVPLPRGFSSDPALCVALRDELYLNYHIEVPILIIDGAGVVRVSAQVYSGAEDLEKFITAIQELSIRYSV